MPVKPIPDGYHTVTPYLTVTGAQQLLDFLKQAFGAIETFRNTNKEGVTTHAEIRIGDSMVMIAEARGEWRALPCALYMYVPDTDAVYRRAMAAGANSLTEPADQFYGDRSAGVLDPCNNQWWIATHIEDVSPQELEKRQAAMTR